MIKYIDHFPDPVRHRFDKCEWFDSYGDADVIIHCKSGEISFPTHWGPLSLKTTLMGTEYYIKNNTILGVNSHCILVFNEDTHYASYVRPYERVESLTFNFGPIFLDSFHAYAGLNEQKLLDDPQICQADRVRFFEHVHSISPSISHHIMAIGKMTADFRLNYQRIEEEMSFLYESLLIEHTRMNRLVDTINAKRRSTREEIYRRVHIARDFIDSCYADPISLEQLSEIAYMSKHHLLRQFKLLFKMTPHQYLTLRRLKEAEHLLKTSHLKLNDICCDVGFEDRSSFTRLFKKHYKQTPAQFRLS
ncbi:helix-turn-helix transcriptional regulator [bacterium]|nr:MAG: helix-turn-helix transcriptional regulator [bacterium]